MKVKYYQVGEEKLMVLDSDKPNKQKMAITKEGKKIYFGDPKMKEYPSTNRGDKYCARSSGISDNNDITPNTLSRKILWKCLGKKSMENFRDAKVKIINKEEYFDAI